MKKLLLSIAIFFCAQLMVAQTTINGSFVFEGVTRTYSFYVPATYTQGQAVPLILNLHGYTSNGFQQSIYSNFKPIADTAGFIIAHPDGTIHPISGQRFWSFDLLGATNVNDIGFLEALIDTIAAHYTINPNRIYSTGMSNGAYMSYVLACRSNRFAAVGSVTGSMSNAMYGTCNPARAIPVMEIHGTSDLVVPYAGDSLFKGIEDVVKFWAAKNGCDSTPSITSVANTSIADNATAEHYVYGNGINGKSVELFKVIGGGHTWPGSNIPLPSNGNTCLDFSASKELWRFFSQYTLSSVAAVEAPTVADIKMYPNPTTGIVHFATNNMPITSVEITDMQGKLVATQRMPLVSEMNLDFLPSGLYVAKITGKNFCITKKLNIR